MRGFGPLRKLSRLFRSALGIGAVTLALGLPALAWPAARLSGQQKSPDQAQDESEASAQQENSTYDPLRAHQDIDVGTFYMHKGDLDAAIARFEDAVRAQPNLGQARLLLGKAYEKKGERAAALKCYKDYLRMYPNAPDAKKIQKKIDKLSAKKR